MSIGSSEQGDCLTRKQICSSPAHDDWRCISMRRRQCFAPRCTGIAGLAKSKYQETTPCRGRLCRSVSTGDPSRRRWPAWAASPPCWQSCSAASDTHPPVTSAGCGQHFREWTLARCAAISARVRDRNRLALHRDKGAERTPTGKVARLAGEEGPPRWRTMLRCTANAACDDSGMQFRQDP